MEFGCLPEQGGLQNIAAYRALVENVHCSAWMDNTTIVTACTLMSEEGPKVITPLTVWDLVTFVRAVVCYERIYHHEHPDIDDARVNQLLGGDVFKSVPLPIRAIEDGRILPDPWDGAHRFMCETWEESFGWLKRLHESVGSETLDGKQIQVVTEAWRAALGRTDLQPTELVDFKEVDLRWQSPSNQLLVDTANVTDVKDTRLYLDPNEGAQRQFKLNREAGIDRFQEWRSHILSDLNLRAYINQRTAEFFALPYACSAGRLPFRDHLHDRAINVQRELVVAKVIDNRYAELAQSVKLRLPIFLSPALRSSITPGWSLVCCWRPARGGN